MKTFITTIHKINYWTFITYVRLICTYKFSDIAHSLIHAHQNILHLIPSVQKSKIVNSHHLNINNIKLFE